MNDWGISMGCRLESREVGCRKQVGMYHIMKEDKRKKPLPPCMMTDEDIECWLYLWLKRRHFLLSELVRCAAQEKGISFARLRKARKQLGVVTWHWTDEKDHPGYWFWELPT